jgi:cyclopropane fatty-acyl-phospholipid synthase-like methyltransferase
MHERFRPARKHAFKAFMDARQYSPSTARNRDPILAVLRRVLPQGASVLELASGTGEHAVHLAAALPEMTWQPSDPDETARASIAAWIAAERLANLRPPLPIDVSSPHWGVEGQSFDALVAINMIHISPWEATLGLMAGAGRLLGEGGVLYTYGAYKRDGRHTAPTNETFDAWLKHLDPRYGVRDIESVEQAARAQGLTLREVIEMPANNLSLIFVG